MLFYDAYFMGANFVSLGIFRLPKPQIQWNNLTSAYSSLTQVTLS